MSESLRRIISRKGFIYNTFDWQEFGEVVKQDLNIRVKMHIVEQIIVENDSSEDLEYHNND